MDKKVYVYDLETLPGFFCAVFKCKEEVRVYEISEWRNDYPALMHFLKNEVEALKGYNNLHFDSQVIEYIWNRFRTPDEIANFATAVIDAKYPPFREEEYHIFNLDIFKILHLDNKNRRVG